MLNSSVKLLELIGAFGRVIDGVLVPNILYALRPANGWHTTDTNVLPNLRDLRVPMPIHVNNLLWDCVQSFTASWLLSGRPTNSEIMRFAKSVMSVLVFTTTGAQSHLVNKHAYRILCSYCGNFECKPGYDGILRTPLKQVIYVP